jgi:hypothetical protein
VRFCPDCGRPKEEHAVERVLTHQGIRNVRVCALKRTSSLPGKPKAFVHESYGTRGPGG